MAQLHDLSNSLSSIYHHTIKKMENFIYTDVPQVKISLTFYEQILHTQEFCEAFL